MLCALLGAILPLGDVLLLTVAGLLGWALSSSNPGEISLLGLHCICMNIHHYIKIKEIAGKKII